MKKLIFLWVCLLLAILCKAKADQNLVELAEKVRPAVVLIETFDRDNKPLGQGSGFFINNEGHIITNHHVIEGAYSATIKTVAGKKYLVERILATEPASDVAKLLVKVNDAKVSFLTPVAVLPSVGEDIAVVGNPFGLESTVSKGIVSAVREIPTFGHILQISAPVSPGSSGSPVLNMKGQVIGVATFILTEGQALNFAVPSANILALKTEKKVTSLTKHTEREAAKETGEAQRLYETGKKKMWSGKWEEAVAYFQKAIKIKADYAEAYYYLGFVYKKLELWKEAIEAYKEAIKIKPDYVWAYKNLGSVYAESGRYQEAIEAYKQAIKINPSSAVAIRGLALTYLRLDQYKEAIEAYKQAIKINPDYAGAYSVLASTYSLLGCDEEALEACKDAIRIEPNDAGNYESLGIAYDGLGHYEEAIQAIKEAIRIDPNHASAYCHLGIAYFHRGFTQDYTEAVEWFLKSAKAGDTDATISMLYLGLMYEKGMGVTKSYAKAAEWYRKAAYAGEALAMFSLGEMYYRGEGVAKDYTEAVKWFLKAAEAGDTNAMIGLGDMYYRGEGFAKDDAKAAEWYRKAAYAGETSAMFTLGWMSEIGVGVERKPWKAIRWYKKAAQLGHKKAQEKLVSLGETW